MKKLTYIGSLLVALLFVSVAAQAQDVVLASIGKSGQTQLEVKFDDKYMNFGTAGGSQEISFKTNTTVTATSSATWCKAAIADGKVNVTAEASNEENIREVIAFPMNGNAQDLMCGAPNEVTEQQLREVHIKIRQ